MTCTKKTFDKKTAQTIANRLSRMHNAHKLRAYRCEACDRWHLTSNRDGVDKWKNRSRR